MTAQDSRACAKIADLRGGYGTTGMRAVFSLPLKEIGLKKDGELKHVEAFSGLGSNLTGATKVLDKVRSKRVAIRFNHRYLGSLLLLSYRSKLMRTARGRPRLVSTIGAPPRAIAAANKPSFPRASSTPTYRSFLDMGEPKTLGAWAPHPYSYLGPFLTAGSPRLGRRQVHDDRSTGTSDLLTRSAGKI